MCIRDSLQAATTDLTPTQLAWVSGYFWGVLNQQPAALAATPAPAAEMPGITIISASQTGNARRVAEALRDDLLAAKLNVKPVSYTHLAFGNKVMSGNTCQHIAYGPHHTECAQQNTAMAARGKFSQQGVTD